MILMKIGRPMQKSHASATDDRKAKTETGSSNTS